MHWARIGEVGFLGGMRFLHWVYRHGGMGPFRVALALIMPWFFLRNGVARRASREYLVRLHETSGGATPPPSGWNVFRHFMSFGENTLENLVAADMREDVRAPFSAEGQASVYRHVDAGRGVLIMTAHLGSLMFLRRFWRAQRAHVRLTLLAHTRHAGRFNQFVRLLNPTMDIDVIQADGVDVGTAMLLSARIAAGGIVVIAGDRIPATPGAPGKATLAASFLGKAAHFPVGPYILAAALACPVFVVFGVRGSQGLAVTVRQLAERIVLPRRGREAAIRPYLETYVTMLAGACAEYPLQWFNFYPFWQTAAGYPELAHDEKPIKPLA